MNREAERKRLVELFYKANERFTDDDMTEEKAVETFVDFLLDNDIVVPPVKVGDKVYVVSQGQGFNMRWDIYEGKVTDIHINCHNELEIRAENGEKFFGYYKPCFVFTSREEAEKALELKKSEKALEGRKERR